MGDLLVRADLDARRLLADADRLEVAELTSSWSTLLRAAEELVGLLAARGGDPPDNVIPSAPPDPSLSRLRDVTDRLDRLRGSTPWLASSPSSPGLLTVGRHVVRARDLVHQHRKVASAPHSDALADGAAARARVMHTLWVSAHAVVLAVRYAARDHDAGSGPRPVWRTPDAGVLATVQSLAESLEQLAGEEVSRSFPTELRGLCFRLRHP